MSVSIIGAGNFGTVLAQIVASNGIPTYLWMRDRVQLEDIQAHNENRRYLPSHKLNANITPTTDLREIANSQLIIVTVPSTSFRAVTKEVARHAATTAFAVSATKGVEVGTFKLMSEILSEELPNRANGVLSGPNLAVEIAEGKVAGTVIASSDSSLRLHVQQCLSCASFRVYASDDVYGVELGGALKNIYAIICGIATGLHVGSNAIALVITRSLVEMARFAEAMKANPYTFLGLAGVGDLMATCTSKHSRNFQLGYQIASGLDLSEAMSRLGKLAEGVNTLKAVYQHKNEKGVYMPLVDALFGVLFKGEEIQTTISHLMNREQKDDVEFAVPVVAPKA